MLRLDEKLARIRAGAYRRSDFIIADAKDPDMGPGLHCGRDRARRDGTSTRLRTRAEFLDSIEAVVKQDIVDIMLASASNLERLVQRKRLRRARASSPRSAPTTRPTSGSIAAPNHPKHPSRPFRSASLSRVRSAPRRRSPARRSR